MVTIHEEQIPEPRGPHADSQADPLLAFESGDRTVLVVYCPRHRCGAIFDRADGTWLMHQPVTLDRFCDMLDDLDVVLPPDANLQAWIDRVTAVLLELHPASNEPA
jgi:hypothetical protein